MTAGCPICGGKTAKYIAGDVEADAFFRKESDYSIAAGGDPALEVRTCMDCGHGFTPLSISSNELAAWYESAPEDETFVSQRQARAKTAQVVLSRLKGLYPDKGALLDIGCGPGLFLEQAEKRGWHVSGIEPSAWAIKWSRKELGDLHIQHGDYTVLNTMDEGSVDVITAFDVIEHVLDPVDFLRAIHRVLKPGGMLILTTPKLDSLLSRLMGKHWYCIFPAHIHYFTSSSFKRLFSDTGFSQELSKRHIRYLGLWYFIGRLLDFLGIRKGAITTKEQMLLPVVFGDEFELYVRKGK